MYLLFAGDQYYPQGGWFDYRGKYSTLEDAEKVYQSMEVWDWGHVVTPEGDIVRMLWRGTE